MDVLFTSSVYNGADWSKRIYKNVTLLETDPTKAFKECQANCYFDGGPCYLFVHDHPICYLGDHNVDSDVHTSTDSVTVYEWAGTDR